LTFFHERNEVTELRYSRGTRSVDEIQRDVDEFWAEFDDSRELSEDVENAGIDVTVLDGTDREGAIRVSARGAGIGPEMVAIVVAFAPAANAVFISLWTEVLLPRIRRRHGRDAIQEEQRSRP
jgi:hypothetical protein